MISRNTPSVPLYSGENHAETIVTLEDRRVLELLATDRATLALIRPGGEDNIRSELLDGSAQDTLEGNIQHLGILLKFAFQFDELTMDTFYAGPPRENQLQRPPEHYSDSPNRWHEFVRIMTCAPTVGLLLHDPDGFAIEKWRLQVGHWDVENRPDPTTLRGRFALRNYNNLLHGSDSPESALHEVSIIVACLKRAISNDGGAPHA